MFISPLTTTGTTRDSKQINNVPGSSFTYDDEGQLASGYGKAYTFDFEHRLTAIGTDTFDYDGGGNRLKASRGGIRTKYIYDVYGNLIAEANSDYVITSYYIYGLGLLAMATSNDETYCYHFDATGNTVALTDLNRAVVNSYVYEPFGAIIKEQETFPQPFKYVGQYGVMAEPNGFYYMRARYYDPKVRRFISEDPIGFAGGDLNLYGYVQNNPVNQIDPSGLYGRDVHYDLTYQLARTTGFTADEAAIVAGADQGMDEGFSNPWNPFGGTQSHFMSREYALHGIDQALQQNSLQYFGQMLHVLQDTYSHAGYKWYTGGHIPAGTTPDNYCSSSPRDSAMRNETSLYLMMLEDRYHIKIRAPR